MTNAEHQTTLLITKWTEYIPLQEVFNLELGTILTPRPDRDFLPDNTVVIDIDTGGSIYISKALYQQTYQYVFSSLRRKNIGYRRCPLIFMTKIGKRFTEERYFASLRNLLEELSSHISNERSIAQGDQA